MTTQDLQNAHAANDIECTPHVAPHVGVVETRRPPNNYMNVQLLDGVLESIETLVEEGCRVVVLRSQGKHFSAGRDFSAPRLPGDMPEDLYERAARLFDSPIPIVAEIQGGAIGAGLGLAAIADFRVVSPRAYFWANFVRLGTHPGFGLTFTLPAIIGRQRARWMFSTGERVNAQTALEWGLADVVASEEELHTSSVEFASKLAAADPDALESLRHTMCPSHSSERFRAATRHEAGEQARLRQIRASSGLENLSPSSNNSSSDEERQ